MTNAAIEIPDTTQIESTRPKGIPLEKVISLRKKGLTLKQIASIVGCSEANISWRLKDHFEDLESLSDFKDNRADILALYQRKLISSLSPDDIKKASAYQRVGMMGILYDKERLERGETTQNIGYADYSKALGQVMKEREKLAAELGIDDTSEDSDTVTEP